MSEERAVPEYVRVRADDLAWALKFMSVDGAHTRAVKDRLAARIERQYGEAS